MKFVVAGLALLIGMSGAAHCQSSVAVSNDRPVHPGTALLDSMGIYAGAPDPAQKDDAEAGVPRTTAIDSPNGATGKLQ